MANPITWRTVAPSNTSGYIDAATRAGESLGDAISGIGTGIQDYSDQRTKLETEAFLADYNSLKTPEERQAMLQAASQAFLDMGQVSEASLAADERGFAADERAMEKEKHEQDLLLGKANLDAQLLELERAEAMGELVPAEVEARRLELQAAQQQNQAAIDNFALTNQASRAATRASIYSSTSSIREGQRSERIQAENDTNTKYINDQVARIGQMKPGPERAAEIQRVITNGLNTLPGMDREALKGAFSELMGRDLENTGITPDSLGIRPPAWSSIDPATNKEVINPNAVDEYKREVTEAITRTFGGVLTGANEKAINKKVAQILQDTPGYTEAAKEAGRVKGITEAAQTGIDAASVQSEIDIGTFESQLNASTNMDGTIGAIREFMLKDPVLKDEYGKAEDKDDVLEDIAEVYTGIKNSDSSLSEANIGSIILRVLRSGTEDSDWQWWTDLKDLRGKDLDDYNADDFNRIIREWKERNLPPN